MELKDQYFHSLLKYTKALSVALGFRDLLTHLHSKRVMGLSVQIGKHFGLSNNEINILKIAAEFHDIGKIGIPDHILLKSSAFDEDEWSIMKQHSEIGEKILASAEVKGAQHVALIVRHHHEYYNGLGYPDKLAGKNIPVCARIISIADSYDAMAETRSYSGRRAHSEIMDILHQESGTKHDPELIAVFSEIIETSQYKAGHFNPV